MNKNFQVNDRIHFIGIGGSSMNGLAQILRSRGCIVEGSDKTTSPFTDRLIKLGIPVQIGQRAENVHDCDYVVYSAAIKEDNPERVRAREMGIPEIERSVALGMISRNYSEVIGIAGCHGKTTITSMLALISEFGGLDATVHVGGMVDFLQGGVRIGSHDLFITEACEYVESFLELHPTMVLINNIDNDHLDYFKTMDNIVNAFRKFLARMPENGVFIGCTDDEHVRALIAEHGGKIYTYGIEREFAPDYYPDGITYDERGCASFELMHRGVSLGRIVLHVPGKHNMLDAIAAAVPALVHNADFKCVADALAHFRAVRRRFEYYGEREGVKIFHDYAHHPAEIRAAVDCGMRTPHEKLYVVFQCNSYTRARTLFTEHVDCFKGVDLVLVPDIYPGRETDDGSVHASDMVAGINRETENALYMPTFEEIAAFLRENASAGDLVLTLGSGDVFKKTKLFLE